MKNFDEWQRERRKESDTIAKVSLAILVLGFAAYFLAAYLRGAGQISVWIPVAIIWGQLLVSVILGVLQRRKYILSSRSEKLEMEERWAREDRELNATVLLPPER